MEQLDELVEALLGFRQSLVLAERREQALPPACSGSRRFDVLLVGMIALGLLTFAAIAGFIEACGRL